MCLKPKNNKRCKVESKDSGEGRPDLNQSLKSDPIRLKRLNSGIPKISQTLKGDAAYAKRLENTHQFAEPDSLSEPLTMDEQYQHPLWLKRSLDLIQRDGQICQCCGNVETHLQVFPLNNKPKGYLWEEDDDILKTVCDSCCELLEAELPKLSGIIAFNILSGKLDVSTLIQLL